MKIVKLISVFITLVFFSCSSKLSKIDYISRSNADSVSKLLLSDEVKNFNHVIFSVAENDFIIIVEKNNYYEEYFC